MNRNFSYRLQRITVIKCSSEITNVKNQAFRWIFHLLHLSPYNNKNFIAVIENRRKNFQNEDPNFHLRRSITIQRMLQISSCFKFISRIVTEVLCQRESSEQEVDINEAEHAEHVFQLNFTDRRARRARRERSKERLVSIFHANISSRYWRLSV